MPEIFQIRIVGVHFEAEFLWSMVFIAIQFSISCSHVNIVNMLIADFYSSFFLQEHLKEKHMHT
jgi:hypothetical protein